MVNFSELESAYKECLGAFEGLRQLGFAAADIYFMANTATKPKKGHKRAPSLVQVGIELHAQGKEFTIVTGMLHGTSDAICRRWSEIAEAMNTTPRTEMDDLDRIWQESMASKEFTVLAASLLQKGFVLPKLPGALTALRMAN